MKKDHISKTAAYLAIKFYGMTRINRYRILFKRPVLHFYEQLIPFFPAPLNWYYTGLKYKGVRSFFMSSNELMLPGDLLHVIARKWYVQQLTEELLEQGFEQILILGSGFDHLGHYYTQKQIPSFEIDTPATARSKRQFLNEAYPGVAHPDVIPVELKEGALADTLRQHPKIDPGKRTIVVAEGFFAYLSYHNVSSTFITLDNYFSHKIAIVSTHFSLDELPFCHRKVYQTSVKMVGEKLQFQTSFSAFKQLVSDNGFSISQSVDTQYLSDIFRKKINSHLPILEGFYILLIE